MHFFRFYLPPDLLKKTPVKITGHDAHHAINVLRLKHGDGIILFDGVKYEYSGKITSTKRGELFINEIKKIRETKIPRPRINLFSALIPKFDFIVEKAAELGVSEIFPIVTERTQVRIKSGSLHTKLERWRKVAIAASMQSGRIVIPGIHEPVEFTAALKQLHSGGLGLLASLERDSIPLFEVLEKTSTSPEDVDMFIGPPADFTDEESVAAKKIGLIPVRISSCTLRTETAALSALAIISSFFYSRSSEE